MTDSCTRCVSAVILNYHDNENTLRLVNNLQACEVIDSVCVVDHSDEGGLTGKEEIFGLDRVLFKKEDNIGYSRGNNSGILAVESQYGLPEFFLISNPDVEVDCRSIISCIHFLDEHPKFALVAPRMLRADGSFHDLTGWRTRTVRGDLAYSSGILARLLGMRKEAYPIDYWNSLPFVQVDCAAGALFLIRAREFRSCGYFDPYPFLFYEEDILGEKLRHMNLGEAILTNFTYQHLEGVSSHVSLKKYLNMQHSRLYFHRIYRHASFGSMLVLYLATALGTIECILKLLLRRGKT